MSFPWPPQNSRFQFSYGWHSIRLNQHKGRNSWLECNRSAFPAIYKYNFCLAVIYFVMKYCRKHNGTLLVNTLMLNKVLPFHKQHFQMHFLSIFLAAISCDQAAIWLVQSVRLSVRPSVRHTFFTMFPSSYHHEIFRSYYQWQKWRPCKRSRSEVKGQGHRGQHPT